MSVLGPLRHPHPDTDIRPGGRARRRGLRKNAETPLSSVSSLASGVP